MNALLAWTHQGKASVSLAFTSDLDNTHRLFTIGGNIRLQRLYGYILPSHHHLLTVPQKSTAQEVFAKHLERVDELPEDDVLVVDEASLKELVLHRKQELFDSQIELGFFAPVEESEVSVVKETRGIYKWPYRSLGYSILFILLLIVGWLFCEYTCRANAAESIKEDNLYYLAILDKHEHVEAQEWATKYDDLELGELTEVGSRHALQRLYEYGAVHVYVLTPYEIGDGEGYSGELLIELPNNPDQREALFTFSSKLILDDNAGDNWDFGQQYIYIYMWLEDDVDDE